MNESPTPAPAHTNRLAGESSPYLLQHRHNPVDWYPWGPEAFEAARAQDKPIFLSVGYSTCYWCHVMERQSFESEAVAAEMNARFVSIKVDREERPDVDQLYMTAVQVLTRHGGWPMSVFLTPDLRPYYGGTYFPPADAHGRPGFVTVLRGLEDAYRNRPGDVERTAAQLARILGQLASPPAPEARVRIDADFVDALVERSIDDFDPVHGGFGGAPKFPRETLLELLLVAQQHRPDERQMAMLLTTLDALAAGGIRDHLGGGFHRYSTDARWLVPHFEIMLYDNAMLAWCFVEAYRLTEDERYDEVARGVFEFVLRELTSPAGAFYTAFDAEVDGQEGLNYLWTPDEVAGVLGADDADLFGRVYGLDQGPNFADPHVGAGAPDRNILFLASPAADEAQARRLADMRLALLAARATRKQPLLDTKVLTSWNALMIRALAYGGQVLQEPRYVRAAARAADFLLAHHRAPDGGLYRTSRGLDAGAAGRAAGDRAGGHGVPEVVQPAKFAAFLDDYAFLAQAMLALHDAGADERYRDEAAALADVMVRKFGDDSGTEADADAGTGTGTRAGGFYFTEAGAADLIVRQKTGADSPLPSGNAVAAMVLQALGKPELARATIAAFAGPMLQGGEGMSAMVQATLLYVEQYEPFVVGPAAGGTAAAARPAAPEQIAANVVGLRATWASPTRLDVAVNVLDGFHVNANLPASGLIATTLSVAGGDVEAVDYPPGELRVFAFADTPIPVYDGQRVFVVRFARPVPAGDILRVTLTYQACDDSACLPPATKRLDVAVA